VLDMHLSSATTDPSTFDLNGFNQTIGGLKRSSTNAVTTVTNSAGGAAKTLTINQATAADYGAGTGAGTITGNLALTKGGSATLTLSAANSYTGGTTIVAGSLSGSVNGAFGAGDVSVLNTAISLTIQTGVADAIANTAKLSLTGGGVTGTADFGFANFGAGVNETVNLLWLNGVEQAPGTYGSTLSGAEFQNDEFFSGTGMVTVLVPEPSSTAMLLPAFAAMLGTRRLRRKH
jgi:autotransporter-associated beta strand protein